MGITRNLVSTLPKCQGSGGAITVEGVMTSYDAAQPIEVNTIVKLQGTGGRWPQECGHRISLSVSFRSEDFHRKGKQKGFESTASGVSWEVVLEGQGKRFFRFLGQNGELNYLELCRVEYTTNLPVPYIFGSCCSQLPIYKGTIDPWFQIYRELEDEGIHLNFKLINVEVPPIVTRKHLSFLLAGKVGRIRNFRVRISSCFRVLTLESIIHLSWGI